MTPDKCPYCGASYEFCTKNPCICRQQAAELATLRERLSKLTNAAEEVIGVLEEVACMTSAARDVRNLEMCMEHLRAAMAQ